MKYIEDCIDCGSEYGKKYIALVSSDDTVKATQLHHIVPVAYYRDVLGVTECRKKGSPDMDPDNLVKLSVGKHLLAHYYLMKCAKKCIKAQMTNAFMCTYKTSSLDGITEEDVLSRMAEIDAEYATLKDGKRPHKDEITVSHGKKKHRLTRWFNGEKYGTYVIYDNKNRLQELGKYGSPIRIRFTYLDEYDEYTKKMTLGENCDTFPPDELVGISIDVDMERVKMVNVSAGYYITVLEQSRTVNHLAELRPNDDEDGPSYFFQNSRAYTKNDILMHESKKIDAWLKKLEFSEETYEAVAAIMELVEKVRVACPHIYEFASINPVLKELSSRAMNRSKDISGMMDDFKEYVESNIIPCDSLPLAS